MILSATMERYKNPNEPLETIIDLNCIKRTVPLHSRQEIYLQRLLRCLCLLSHCQKIFLVRLIELFLKYKSRC